ncbi:endonuclease/exonuclease/phosphatase family protein [Seonamhaeicola sp. ML3]|uniref:endonuclease/exonuclease/phosphatase family protein n=1 Tax=Seonamhaeicola sp. ML3 TaxID=2937786 RepID=UPI00200FB3DB|nr:endonuclease/exonuclease/phosphatase family protein [Seonamhaeicola sp. ML3]
MKGLSFFNKIIYFVNVIAALALLFSFILPYLPPKTFAVLSVLNLGVSLLIILNIIFALYWLVRLKRQFLLSFLILFIGYVAYGSLYKFSSSKAIDNEGNFKVMNYNVRLFNVYDWIKEDGLETKIIDFIKTEAPDVLSVQEYHPHENVDLSFFKYKFEKLSGKRTKYGQAIFSKFPIVNSGSIEFPNTGNNAIFADIKKGTDTIRVYNIHLESLRINTNVDSLKKENSERLLKRIGSTFKMQQFQMELFLMHKNQCKHKMVVCGDFNNTAFSYVYRKIKGDLIDTYLKAGTGFGKTHDFKYFPMRIDFIFADEAFQVNGFKAFDKHYSDHFPIMATLSLED